MPESEAEKNKARELAFQEKQKRVLGTYYEQGKFLPPDNLSVVTVVPVAAELANGNLWKMVESLSELNDENTPENFEVLLVVNNRPQTEEDQYYKENQQTLLLFNLYDRVLLTTQKDKSDAVIEAFQDALQALNITQLRIDQLLDCLKKRVRIHAIDASSQTKAINLKDDEFHYMPGAARDIGGIIAAARMPDGIIDFKDADCSFPANYFSDLSKLHEAGKAEMVSFAVDVGFCFLPEVDMNRMQTPEDRLKSLDFYAANIFKTGRPTSVDRYIHVKKAYSFGDSEIDGSIDLNPEDYEEGPQLAVSSKLFKQMLGYPESGYHGEDYEAVYKANKRAEKKIHFAAELPYLATVPGKFDSGDLLNWKKFNYSDEMFAHGLDLQTYFTLTADMYSKYADSEVFTEVLNAEYAKEKQRRLQAISDLKNLVHAVRSEVTPDVKTAALLKENSYATQFVKDCMEISQLGDPDALIVWIQNRFPQLYGLPPEQPDYEALRVGVENKTSSQLNARDYLHTWRAAYIAEARSEKQDVILDS